MKPLYHYCSTETFFNIVTSSHVRLFNLFESNDYLERRLVDSDVHKLLDELVKASPSAAAEVFKSTVIADFELNRNIHCYFSSFSEEGDMLSQWRGYADDGRGVSIGFDLECLQIPEQIPSTSAAPKRVIGVFKLVYDPVQIHKMLAAAIYYYWQAFQKDGFASTSPAMIECAGALVRVASAVKHRGFSEEKEWRLLYTPIPTVISNYHPDPADLVAVDIRNEKYCVRRGTLLSSYFEMNITSSGGKRPIIAIVLGPKNSSSPEAIGRFLAGNGHVDVRVRKSEASYREFR